MMRLIVGFSIAVSMIWGVSPACRADFITDFTQQVNLVQDDVPGDVRAVYLGRLDFAPIPANIGSFTGVFSIVNIIDAQSVSLYAGNGSTDFFGNVGDFSNTGVVFNTVTSNMPEGLIEPGLDLLGNPIFLPLSPAMGTNLLSQLQTNGHLDFWLVGDGGAGGRDFNAPVANVPEVGPSLPFQFAVQFEYTAVPEPGAMGVLLMAFSGVLLRRRAG